jgi:hypothetical protein
MVVAQKQKTLVNINLQGFLFLAEWTGLEPATPCVTGMYSNQLNYHSVWDCKYTLRFLLHKMFFKKNYKMRVIRPLAI